MDVMSVAAMSISMHQGQLQQAVSVSLMREVPGSRLDILA